MTGPCNQVAAPIPVLRRYGFWREVACQLLHFLAALIVVKLVRLSGADLPPFSRALIGLSLGLCREITEWLNAPSGKGHPWSPGSLRDLTFWSLGGLAG